MTYTGTYQLTNLLHGLRFHGSREFAFVADSNEVSEVPSTGLSSNSLELESHIRSGDYFSVLATKLDDFSTRLDRGDTPQRSEIDSLVSDLLYVDQHYRLVRKI